ncbi:hypothetical protein QQZ08_002951 [Neonectria magnoliae]|uniref:Isochorismatase-like domain-containing protein n=1 Tax=Neonectria magnoliae TaxID=2732573 RepID=A0ABR1IBX9_9HYPO
MSTSPLVPKTAVVLIDPYNDFLHPEGKLYPAIGESLAATDTVSHLKKLVTAAREFHIPIYYGPHQTSFANTDLDYELHQREITHLVMTDLVANTCLETTARYARELGYHVTLLTDGTAGFTIAVKDAAVNLIWPQITDRVMTVGEWVSTVKKDVSEK